MNKTDEVRRLERVYRQYREEGKLKTHWAEANPGNQAMVRQRMGKLAALLQQRGLLPLTGKRVLEIGSGSGRELERLRQWGASPPDLLGVDLLSENVAKAREDYPELRFEQGNAERLDWPDHSFDLVMFSTVFSSINDREMARRVAAEACRVLKPGGAIIWYDFRFNNPWNTHVHGVGKEEIAKLFPSLRRTLRRTTLLPPLARRLGVFTRYLYAPLPAIAILNTHYIGLLEKPPV